MGKTGYLVLENGKTFRGERFGAEGEVTAEVVFSTGMTGYLETLTDPGYFGQTVVQTFPLIGNYGVIASDLASDLIGPRAYIVRQWCQAPSNFRSEGSLDTFFQERNVTGLCGIDTRTLTKILRENGVMNGIITDDPSTVDRDALKAYRITGAVQAVTTREKYEVGPENGSRRVALIDYGLQRHVWDGLTERNARVTVCPAGTTAQELKAMGPDGVMLSGGPGDPAEDPELIRNLKEISELGIPVLGVCLGHEMMALARGFRTEKLKYGHRGANQPVKDRESGRVYITGQNHGYAVVGDSIDSRQAEELFVNVNDGTCEGIRYRELPILTTQFQPEAVSGLMSTGYVFDEFFAMMKD